MEFVLLVVSSRLWGQKHNSVLVIIYNNVGVLRSTGNAVAQSFHGCFFALKTIGSSTWAQIAGRLNRSQEPGP